MNDTHVKQRPIRFSTLVVFAAALFAVSVPSSPARSDERPADPVVTTVAGSGTLGIDDGPAAASTFITPTGLAMLADGSLLVADSDAQRIRKIDRQGNISTFAGSGEVDPVESVVRGGFADGPRATAKFNHPSGLLVLPNGDVLVADTYNHCVRRISGDMVSTYLGVCGSAGITTGAPGIAKLAFPRALALGPDGHVYVAQRYGIREFDANLNESVLAVPIDTARGISIAGSTLFASDERGLLIVDLAKREKPKRLENAEFEDGRPPTVESFERIGHPNEVLAISSSSVLVSDLVDNCLRLVTLDPNDEVQVRVVGATPSEVADVESGSFRDGAGTEPRFNAPETIVGDRHGGYFLADSANRRIRHLSAFASGAVDLRASVARLAASKSRRRVFLVGNSFADFNSDRATTIASSIAASLIASGHPEFTIDGGSIPSATNAAIGKYLDEFIADGPVTDVVIVEDRIGINDSYFDTQQFGVGDAARWSPRLRDDLDSIARRLRTHGVRTFVVFFPTPLDLPPGESGALVQARYTMDLPWGWLEGQLNDAVRGASFETIDLWPTFRSAIVGSHHVALFGTDDIHPNAAGRAVAASEIARRLLETRAAAGK